MRIQANPTALASYGLDLKIYAPFLDKRMSIRLKGCWMGRDSPTRSMRMTSCFQAASTVTSL